MLQRAINAITVVLSDGDALSRHLDTPVTTIRRGSGVMHSVAFSNALARLVGQPRTEVIPSGLRRPKNGTIRVRSYRRKRPAPTLENMVEADGQDREAREAQKEKIKGFIREQIEGLNNTTI